MSLHRPPRSKALLDAIDAEIGGAIEFDGSVWRVVSDGFDPLRPSRSGGRWDDGTFDVLYTASERDGALAESWFHAAKGQPILPSKVSKRLYEIEAHLERVLDLSKPGRLEALGVGMGTFGRLHYLRRAEEYPTLQQIGEAAFFYDCQAIIVPCARWPSTNVVIMTEHVSIDQLEVVSDEPVDLGAWDRQRRASQPKTEA